MNHETLLTKLFINFGNAFKAFVPESLFEYIKTNHNYKVINNVTIDLNGAEFQLDTTVEKVYVITKESCKYKSNGIINVNE